MHPESRAFRGGFVATIHGLALAAVFGLILSDATLAQDYAKGSLRIERPWTRATPRGAEVAAGYMAIENRGANPDRLTGAASDVATKVEVHEMTMAGGVMKMRPLSAGLPIAPGKTVKLEPGGYHIMFMGLKHPLAERSRVKATLQFENAGPVEVEFAVQAMGAGGGMPGH